MTPTEHDIGGSPRYCKTHNSFLCPGVDAKSIDVPQPGENDTPRTITVTITIDHLAEAMSRHTFIADWHEKANLVLHDLIAKSTLTESARLWDFVRAYDAWQQDPPQKLAEIQASHAAYKAMNAARAALGDMP